MRQEAQTKESQKRDWQPGVRSSKETLSQAIVKTVFYPQHTHCGTSMLTLTHTQHTLWHVCAVTHKHTYTTHTVVSACSHTHKHTQHTLWHAHALTHTNTHTQHTVVCACSHSHTHNTHIHMHNISHSQPLIQNRNRCEQAH